MRKTRSLVITLLALFPCVLLMAPEALACSAIPYRPERLVANAEVIVRATASRYASAAEVKPEIPGAPVSAVEFRVEETLKGEGVPDTLVINGRLSDRDDYNERPVPYDFIRPDGRAGSCIADTYKKGAEFLLLLRKQEGKLTPYWAALSPTNEQLRPGDDAWLKWVKDSLQSGATAPAGQTANPRAGRTKPAAEDELTRVEEQWHKALERADIATLERILAADWFITNGSGNMIPKAELLSALRSGEIKFVSTVPTEIKVHVYDRAAVVTKRSTDQTMYGSTPGGGRYQMTDTFVWLDGRWQCVATHASKDLKP